MPGLPSTREQGRNVRRMPSRKPSTTALVAVGALAIGAAVAPVAATGAINYFHRTRTVTAAGTVACPSGWHVTGGGVRALPAPYFGTYVHDQYQLSSSAPTTTGWRATAVHVKDSYSPAAGWQYFVTSYTPTVVAICTS